MPGVLDFDSEEAAVATVDGWIEKLWECKPLTEGEVRQLCEKVGDSLGACREAPSVAKLNGVLRALYAGEGSPHE